MNSDSRISSPYTVKVIGDKSYLMSTLNLKNSGFVDLMRVNNLEITVEESKNVVINKYSKEITAEKMKEVEWIDKNQYKKRKLNNRYFKKSI